MTKQEIMDAIAYIGVDPCDFNLKNSYFKCPIAGSQRSRIHGIGHIYRVMIGTALLAKEIHEQRLGLYAFCGAFLHDLARETDGGDFGHGLRSATESFDQFNHIWDKYRLSAFERELIRAASANHTDRSPHTYHGTWIVDQMVREADALDRCRFVGRSRLNPQYLQIKESKRLIKSIEEICALTNNWAADISLVDFIDKATAQAKSSAQEVSIAYNREYAPEKIKAPLADHQVFVFNQKMRGNSAFRTAKAAVRDFGAARWVGEGLTGQAYAIPTDLGRLEDIQKHVDTFVNFAKANPQLEFLVTKIACGGAGRTIEEIAPMFKNAINVENILLPKEFVDEIAEYK